MAKELKELTKRSVNYSQWYQDLVIKAGQKIPAVHGYQTLRIRYLGKMQRYDMFQDT